jgi:hypothetical protein
MATPNSNIADHLPSVARLLAASRPPPEPVHQSLVQPGYRNLRPKPEQVYNPKNPRAFPTGRLELDIKKQRCIMGRDTFMNLQVSRLGSMQVIESWRTWYADGPSFNDLIPHVLPREP